jgi:heat shock protein HslJ
MLFAHARLVWMTLTVAAGLVLGLSACTATGPSPVVSALSEQNLQAKEWTAISLDGVARVANPKPTLRWSGSQQIVGSAGCNQFRGRAVLEGNSLRIGPIAGIGLACITAPSGQEDMFFKAMENTRNARIEDGQLVLLGEYGKELARLDASASK